jgi:hypothetical protein
VSLLGDFTSLIESMKKAGLGAVESKDPTQILFGTVISASPLKIQIEQKLTLDESYFVLARNVTDYQVEMSIDHWTENETAHVHAVQDTYTGGGTSSPTSHRHEYKGRKTFTVHNKLKEGEGVILIRVQGGQKFIVIDRLGG